MTTSGTNDVGTKAANRPTQEACLTNTAAEAFRRTPARRRPSRAAPGQAVPSIAGAKLRTVGAAGPTASADRAGLTGTAPFGPERPSIVAEERPILAGLVSVLDAVPEVPADVAAAVPSGHVATPKRPKQAEARLHQGAVEASAIEPALSRAAGVANAPRPVLHALIARPKATGLAVGPEGPVGLGHVAEIPRATVDPRQRQRVTAGVHGAVVPSTNDAVASVGLPLPPAAEVGALRPNDTTTLVQLPNLRLHAAAVTVRTVGLVPTAATPRAEDVRPSTAATGDAQRRPATGNVPRAQAALARVVPCSARHVQEATGHVLANRRLPSRLGVLTTGVKHSFCTDLINYSGTRADASGPCIGSRSRGCSSGHLTSSS